MGLCRILHSLLDQCEVSPASLVAGRVLGQYPVRGYGELN